MNRSSKITFYFCAIFLFVSTFFTHRWNVKYNAVITYDAAGYYMYLPSIFYDDLGKINNKDYITEHYNPYGCNFEDANKKVGDNYILKYTAGVAILELPAFIIAHFIAKTFNYPVDGFSLPYQVSINFWSILFGIFGLWKLRKLLIKFFNDNVVAVTLLTLSIATNLYNFIAFSGNMSHGYLFTLYVLLLFYTDKFYDNPNFKISILIGFLSGMLVLIRPTEIICLIIIFFWKVSNWNAIYNRILFVTQHFSKFITLSLTAITIGCIQLIYWKTYSGHWVYWSYGENETFSFLYPHFVDWMISYKKGWLTYTPVMILSLVGFYNLFKQHRQLFITCFLFTIFNIYLCSSWDCWWYGGSFSQRSVVQSYAILSFPLAAFIQFVFNKRMLLLLTLSIIAFCTWLNFVMTYQAYTSKGIMENDMMSKKYYWKIFGKTNINKLDKKYIDLQDEIPHQYEHKLKEVYFTDFENDSFADTCQATSGIKGILLNKFKQNTQEIFIPINKNKQGYYRATANFFANDKEWNVWKQTQWIITLYHKEQLVKTNYYRIHRIIEPNSWQNINIDIKTPKNTEYDKLSIKFWNADSDKQLQIDDLKVYFTEY